ncbi:hypothetical protein [Mucilaginibacter sp.]|uniref:hypothetical protein n=1 Tax=Mucilaginibacter sp. TaxID=1882438 RepID=UPI0026046298|nr:hypothetical protein [Mucilaginibacter sp.]
MADKEIVPKELDLIQDVIKRMATNSFQVKTWMMSIVTAILAFKNTEVFSAGLTKDHHGVYICLVLLMPIICFWYLDGFFLRTEKLYRELYKWVIANRPKTDRYLYDLNTLKRENFVDTSQPDIDCQADAKTVWDAMKTKTLLPFYLVPFLLVVFLAAYNWFSL